MRKALVNDVVHSFCYACRNNVAWPVVILSDATHAFAASSLPAGLLTPFVAYAFSVQSNYILANRQVILLAGFLRTFSPTEQLYASALLERYYGYSTREVSCADDTAIVR